MALRPDLQPDNAGGAGPRPTAGPREIEAGGQCGAPSAAGGRLGIGSGGASTGSGCSPVSSDESPVAWLLCSLPSLRSRVSIGGSGEFARLPKETGYHTRERREFSRPYDGTIGGGDKKEPFLFYFFSTSTCPI